MMFGRKRIRELEGQLARAEALLRHSGSSRMLQSDLEGKVINGSLLIWKYANVDKCEIKGDVVVYGSEVKIEHCMIHGKIALEEA